VIEMGKRREPYYRFELLKSVSRWNLFYDQESQSVPYIVIEKKKDWPEKTADLIQANAVLFSSEKLVEEYFQKNSK
jgi:hypothetical protein